MKRQVVAELARRKVGTRPQIMARIACEAADAVPDQAAYHVQQAAEKLTKAALVAYQIRPRKGHVIGDFAKRLPADVRASRALPGP